MQHWYDLQEIQKEQEEDQEKANWLRAAAKGGRG
jgi:hypothetical protein